MQTGEAADRDEGESGGGVEEGQKTHESYKTTTGSQLQVGVGGWQAGDVCGP